MTEERRIQLVADVDTTRTREGFQEIGQQATTMSATVAAAGDRAGRAVGGVGDGADRAARNVENAQRSLIGSIQRTTAAMEAGGRSSSEYFAVLARQRGIDPAILEPYLAQLRAVEAAQGRTNTSLGGASTALNGVQMSARATAAALRGVPAQLTDIAVSLQGGQSPLTVLLQQGGQLRDMFGSVGGAVRALGTTIMGLITPVTVVVAAVAALGLAYNEGSKEAQAYSRALILNGNVAGTTSDQLSDMARNISKSVGTQGAAAEALAALAGTGKVGAANLQRFGETAVRVQKAIGQSAADTANIFADLGKAPLAASEKLNDQYRYLTASIYEQIKALQDQGRTQEAGEVAQRAYADAMDSRSNNLVANLGLIERAWAGITGAAKWAYDAMLDVGREDTLEQKLAKVQASIAKGQKPFDASFGGNAEDRGALKKNLELKASLEAQIEAKKSQAALDAESARLNEAGIAWQKQKEQGLTRELQLQRDVAMVRQKGLDAGASDADIAVQVGEIRKKYADIAFKSINDQIAAVEQRGKIEEEVAKRSAMAVASAQASGIATSLAAQIGYAEQVEALDQAALAREKARLQALIALQKQLPDSPENRKAQDALRGQIALNEEQSLTRKAQLKNQIYELDVKDTRQAAANLAALGDKRAQELQSLQAQVLAQRDANAQIGMSKLQIADYNVQLTEQNALQLESRAATIGANEARKEEAAAMMASAQQMRELAAAQREGVIKSEVFEQQKAFWGSIEQTAHQTFVSIADGGKGAAQRLKDAFKNGFFDWLYQMTLKKWVVNISGGVLQDTSVAGAAQALSGTGSAIGGANSAIQAASSASSLYSLVTGGLAGVGSKIGSIGSSLGSTIIADFGAGLSGQAAAAAQAYSGLAGATTMSTAASAGASINAAIAAIPGWGWAIVGAAAAAKVFGLFDGKGPEKNTRLTFTSNNTPGNISINERGNEGKTGQSYIDGSSTGSFGTFGLSSTFWSDGFSDTVQGFIKTVTKVDDVLAGYLTVGEKSAATAAVTGNAITANLGAQGTDQNGKGELDAVFAKRLNLIFDSLSPGMSSLISGFKGTSQELATEAAALLQYRQALAVSGEALFGAKVTLQDLAALKAPTEATSAALSRITSEFTVTNGVAAALGKTAVEAFGTAGLASVSAREQLITLSGGIDLLAKNTSGFAQNYLTEAERLAPVAKSVASAMADLGLASVDTRDEFKAVVQGLDLTTEAGAKQYAQLMGLQEAFAQVYPAAESAAAILELQAQRYEVLGDKAGAAAILEQQHVLALKDMAPVAAAASVALWDAQKAEKSRAEALTISNGVLANQAAYYEATSDKAGAAVVAGKQWLAALAEMDPALRESATAAHNAQLAQKAANEAAEENNKLLGYRAAQYAASGDKGGAASVAQQQFEASLVGLSPALIAAATAAHDAQLAEKSRSDALVISNGKLANEAAYYEAVGDKAGAAAVAGRQWFAAVEAMDPVLRESANLAHAAQVAQKERNDALAISNGILVNQAAYYEATGDKANAAAVAGKQWLATLTAMDPALRASASAAHAAQIAEKERTDALTISNGILANQAAYYEAIGDKAGAASVAQQQWLAALVEMEPALQASAVMAHNAQLAEKERAEALSESNALLSVQAQTYAATGDAAAAATVLAQQQVNALVGLSPALAAATQAMWAAQKAAEQKKRTDDLTLEMLNAQGKAQEALNMQRRAELSALSATEQAIKQATYAAIDKAKTNSLQMELLSAQGNDAEVKRLQRLAELAQLSAGDQAIKLATYAALDKAEADKAAAAMAQQFAEAQARAAEQAKTAAEALKNAWQGLTDSIFDEVARIRGLMDGNGAQTYAGAQSAFAIATAQARAGDQEAAKLLPGLSKAMLDLAEANAVTAFDLRLARAQAAASLYQTGSMIGGQYGIKVPAFAEGTDYVSRTGFALIHEGEKITPAASNRPFTSSAGGMSDVVNVLNAVLAENRAIKAEIAELRRTNSNENVAIAKNTGKTSDALDGAVNGDRPLATKEIA